MPTRPTCQLRDCEGRVRSSTESHADARNPASAAAGPSRVGSQASTHAYVFLWRILAREGAPAIRFYEPSPQVQQVSVNGTSSAVCTGRVCNPFHANSLTEHR